MVVRSLKIKLASSCGAENAAPVCLIHDRNRTASAAYTLMACDLEDTDLDLRGEDVTGSDVIGGDVVAKACKTRCVSLNGRC